MTAMAHPYHHQQQLEFHDSTDQQNQLSSYHQLNYGSFDMGSNQNDMSAMLYHFSRVQSLPLDSGYAATEDMNPFEKSGYWPDGHSIVDFDYYSNNPGSSSNAPSRHPSQASSCESTDYGPLSIPSSSASPGFAVQQIQTELYAPAQDNSNNNTTTHMACAPSQQKFDRYRTMSLQDTASTSVLVKNEVHSPTQTQMSIRRPGLKRSLSDDTTDQSATDGSTARGRPKQRIPHTTVERRYRENLNLHLQKLRAAVPKLHNNQRKHSLTDTEEAHDGPKPSKCEILVGAVEHIAQLEAENLRLTQKMQRVCQGRRF